MRSKQLLSIMGCGLAALSSCAAGKKQVAEKPNILFILADDHARTAISAYGGINSKLAPTPNIDAIGENGAIMQNMLCTNSISGPSRACLLTGKYSTSHGFYQNEGGIVFDNTQQQYQKILRDNGYTTALFGKWHLFSDPAGFDYYKIHANASQQGTYWDPIYSTNGRKTKEKGYATKLTTTYALQWLDSLRDVSKPFCLMLHYKAPHRPWEPDSCYLNLFDEVEFPYPATFDDDYKGREKTLGQSMGTIENHLSRGDLKQTPPEGLSKQERNKWLWWGGSGKDQFWTPDPKLKGEELKKWKFQTYLKNYLRVVRSVDDQVGRVVAYLKEKGLYEKYPYFYGEMPLDMMLYADTMAGDDTSDNGKTPRKAMADIIGNENCVVVGRCGNNAFRHREDVISVFLTGNKEKRAELIEKKHNVSPKKAAKIVEDTDLRRRSYHNYYTGEEWGNAEYYDICIDVSKVGEDGALRLIEAYINETGVL